MGNRGLRDEVRTSWLKSQGIDVLRIAAKDVLADADEVADALLRLCNSRAQPLHRSAPPSGPPPRASAAGRNM
jgi:very-short-patch-repair endonuclease